MDSTYNSLFIGNSILVAKIVERLQNIGIIPIVKDRNESGRLGGFGQMIPGQQEIVVSDDELTKAKEILAAIDI